MEIVVRKASDVKSYVTKDSSLIFEVLHPSNSPISNGSVAVAVVGVGKRTKKHYHKRSEEVYLVWKGRGIVHVGSASVEVTQGCFVLIPPRTEHWMENKGSEELVVVCFSSPPYSHEDTVLVD